MLQRPVACPHCGSRHTETRNRYGSGIISWLLEKMGDLADFGRRFPGGRKFIVCKVCGKMSVIFIN